MSTAKITGLSAAETRRLINALTAARDGDFSVRLPAAEAGPGQAVAKAFNALLERNAALAAELERVSQAAGREGRLSQRARLAGGAGGAWEAMTAAVNSLVEDLAHPIRETTRVLTALTQGDLTQTAAVERADRPLAGEPLNLAQAANGLGEHLTVFTAEVGRVIRHIGVEGRLSGQAQVPGAAGVWRELTAAVNHMASNLTAQVRNIAEVTAAVAAGDLSRKITVDVHGHLLQLKDTINNMVDQLRTLAAEVTRVTWQVGTEGKLGGQAIVPGVGGVWQDLTKNVNRMSANLTAQVRNIAEVTQALAAGDLSPRITVEAQGEVLVLKTALNAMLDRLTAFALEVTRVARQVGVEGQLGGQAHVPGAAGIWKDLTDNVNQMAANLTDQVRGLARVLTAVAAGDLSQKVPVQARGEIAALGETLNRMTATLAMFADEVTAVAQAVGVEGRLGGQAQVPDAAGRWRGLTDTVNQMAASLTDQMRAIAEVATAVTRGDLSRSITVAARGEVADLQRDLNTMIQALRETTRRNAEQDWLKTSLAHITRLLQGQRELSGLARRLLAELAPLVGAAYGVLYVREPGAAGRFQRLSEYALPPDTGAQDTWRIGEGLAGQVALDQKWRLFTNVPPDYVQISFGLGQAAPLNLVILPVLFEYEVKAVIELAAFEPFSPIQLTFLEQLFDGLGVVFNSIEATSRTEELLEQSKRLAEALQSQQEALQQTNAELHEKARLLVQQNDAVARQNREIEVARAALESQTAELAAASRYKSEFLANMSHELRTPLNAILAFSESLLEQVRGPLNERQQTSVRHIEASGRHLLALINDILDLSKIEAGHLDLHREVIGVADICQASLLFVREQARRKNIQMAFQLEAAEALQVRADPRRLKQMLVNLLTNAVKFTPEGGRVSLEVSAAEAVYFQVRDTGIGIAPEALQRLFQPFVQLDSSLSRPHEGTGLGLALVRRLVELHGGSIAVESAVQQGSCFTLALPGPAEAEPEAGETAAPAVTAHLPGPAEPELRVLLAEDNELNIEAVGDYLQLHGCQVAVARSGREALTRAAEVRPAVILMDIQLPDLDGLEAMRCLRSQPEFAATPIIALTALAMPGDRERCLAAGANEYLVKPVSLKGLLAALRQQAVTAGAG